MFKNFNDAVAAFVSDTDNHFMYRAFGFHPQGERWLVFSGDTGGRWFKFGFIDTHMENANSGSKWRLWYMVERFKETYANLELIFTPLIGTEAQSIFNGEKAIFRACQTCGA